MFLFWKHVDFSTYELTKTDRIVNYTVGILQIFCFLISTILNPVIWYHNRSEDKKKITTFLFSCLAIADFLTNLVAPLGYCYLLMSPKLFSERDFTSNLSCIISCTMGCMSQCVATLLAVSRTLKIINPFRSVNKQVLKYYLLCYTLFMMVSNISLPVIDSVVEKKLLNGTVLNLRLVRSIIFIFIIVCYWLNIVHCIIGTIFSMISVLYVHVVSKAVSQNHSIKKRASITILLMNMVYIITMACMFLNVLQSRILKHGMNLFAMSFVFAPILTAALNPIVLFTRVQKIRQTFYSLIRSCFELRMRFGRIRPVSIDNAQIC